MPESAFRPASIPAPYRLALALSLAFLVHTLLLAGLPSPLKDTREVSHRLVFTLNTPAVQPSSANLASAEDTGISPTIRHPDFVISPPSPEITTLDSARQIAVSPEIERSVSDTRSRPEVGQNATPSQSANAESAATAALPANAMNAQEMIQTITKLPSEQDPYLILLATHLAETLEHQRVPAISKLRETVSMELELRILPNGALTRARVIQSTGLPGIDEAAYRAALAASPYPEPEGEKTDRFEVTLVFTSKRQ